MSIEPRGSGVSEYVDKETPWRWYWDFGFRAVAPGCPVERAGRTGSSLPRNQKAVSSGALKG